MKTTTLTIVSVTAGILALILAVNGNAYADYDNDDESYGSGEHGNYAGELKIFIHFDENPSYYGDGIITANGHDKKLDIGELTEKYVSPFWIEYYYYGYKPNVDQVCLKNLDSGKKNCVEADSNNEEVDINMPD